MGQRFARQGSGRGGGDAACRAKWMWIALSQAFGKAFCPAGEACARKIAFIADEAAFEQHRGNVGRLEWQRRPTGSPARETASALRLAQDQRAKGFGQGAHFALRQIDQDRSRPHRTVR